MMAWFVQGEYKDRDEGTHWSPDIIEIASEHARLDENAKLLDQELERKWITEGRDIASVNFPSYSSKGLPRLSDGWRFPPFDAPLNDQLAYEEDTIVDIVSSSFGTYAISEKVIDIIECIEPGVHQFIPYRMLNPDGSVHSAMRWLLNICTRAEVIDAEKSNVAWVASTPRRKFADITAGGRRPHVVAKADEVAKRAVWCEWRYHSGTNFIVSDRLWSALQSGDIRGWAPHYSYPDHIEEI
ncbi:MAG: DUF1629 domain-containing protein [Sphingomonas sp.]